MRQASHFWAAGERCLFELLVQLLHTLVVERGVNTLMLLSLHVAMDQLA